MGCYVWYTEEGTGQGRSPSRTLLAVPNVTTALTKPVYQSPYCCITVRCSAVLGLNSFGLSNRLTVHLTTNTHIQTPTAPLQWVHFSVIGRVSVLWQHPTGRNLSNITVSCCCRETSFIGKQLNLESIAACSREQFCERRLNMSVEITWLASVPVHRVVDGHRTFNRCVVDAPPIYEPLSWDAFVLGQLFLTRAHHCHHLTLWSA